MKTVAVGKLVGEIEYRDGKPFAVFIIDVGTEGAPVYIAGKTWDIGVTKKLEEDVNASEPNYLTCSGSLKKDSFNGVDRLELGVNRFIIRSEHETPSLRVKAEGELTSVSDDGARAVLNAHNYSQKENDELVHYHTDADLSISNKDIAANLEVGLTASIEGAMAVVIDGYGDIESMMIAVQTIKLEGRARIGTPLPAPAPKPAASKPKNGKSRPAKDGDPNDAIPF